MGWVDQLYSIGVELISFGVRNKTALECQIYVFLALCQLKICSFIHSFIQQIFIDVFYEADITLYTRDKAVNIIGKNPCYHGAYIQV